MAESIKIQLADFYEPVTEEQVQRAKNYVLRRESAARGLSSLIDALLQDAAVKITSICYRYNINPTLFELSYKYNEKMFEEVAAVMDELEEDILDLVSVYSTKCTKDKEKKNALFLWILTLGRGGKALKATLETRLRAFMGDLEAMIVAAKVARLNTSQAANIIKNNLHNVYQTAIMKNVFRQANMYKAKNIRTKGIKHGNVGNSNSEANNIIRFAKTTLQMAWMRQMRQNYKDEGAAGFMCFRGSTFHCPICDDVCNKFYSIDSQMPLPVHPSCCCYAIPVYQKTVDEMLI